MDNKFITGAVVCVIGLCTVFLVLIILWLSIELMHALLTRGEKKENAPAPAAAPPAVKEAAPAPQAAPAVLTTPSDDSELIAVLTAAIAASLGRPTNGLNIKSYRRVSSAPIWNKAARRDNLI